MRYGTSRLSKERGASRRGRGFARLVRSEKNQTAQSKPDFTLRIAPVSFDIAPGKTIHTFGYNGQVPGPLLRMKEGVPVTVDVFNDTDHEEIVHWHGQMISAKRTVPGRKVVRQYLHTGITIQLHSKANRFALVPQPRVCGERPSSQPLYRPVRLRLYRTEE